MALSYAIGMVAQVSSGCSVLLGALIWLCPFWINPTPSVVPLLWGGAGLALWALLCAPSRQTSSAGSGFTFLLFSLGLLIVWRSPNNPNALAAAVCLAAIWLAAQIAQTVPSRTIAMGWLAGALINAAIALCQYAGVTDEPLGTAFGLLRQRNQMATLCNIGLLALLYLSARKTFATPASLAFKLGWHALAWLLAIALAATSSRVGVLGLCLVILFGWLKKEHRALTISLLAAYILAAWVLPQLSSSPESVMGRLLTTTQGLQLQDGRRSLWSNALDLIRLQPLLGVGWRELAYSFAMTDFAPHARFGGQADHAHNLPLQLAAELGLPAASLWLSALAVWLLWQKPWRSRDTATLMAWGVLAVIGIHSLLEYPLWYAPFQIAAGLAVGIILLKPPLASATRTAPPVSDIGYAQSWHPARLVAISLFVFCTYASIDYFRVAQIFKPANERFSLLREHTIAKAEGTWLFAAQVRYAKLITTPVTPENAKAMYALAESVLHFSPEPRVFKVLIQAGELLAHSTTPPSVNAASDLQRYRRQLSLIEAAAQPN